jgi:hypothetical protein
MFLIDIPFKSCQGRSTHSSIVHVVSYFACGVNDTACTVHAVSVIHRACCVNDTTCTVHAMSLTPYAFLIFFFAYHLCFAYDFSLFEVVQKFVCACGVNDTACYVHAVSMTPDAQCMRCQ